MRICYYWIIMGRHKLNNGKKSAIINAIVKTEDVDIKIANRLGVSRSMVQVIKKTEADVIKAKKEKYIKLIDSYTKGDIGQAQKIGKMLSAKTAIFNFKGQVVGYKADHKIRLEAIKYIDKLKGREQSIPHLTQNNILISKELDRYTRS